VSGFNAIIGQRLPIRLLKQFLRSETVPHALLFTGIDGVGKRTAAGLFAAALNCHATPSESDERPCGRCRSCRRIAAGVHPDVITIDPRKNTLKIDQIRALLATLALKPFDAGRRVVIIDQSQKLTAEAANALLKILEEPPENTILILTALQPSDLLPTVVSRCRHIHFRPLAPEDLSGMLMTQAGVDADQAAVIGEQADGSFEKARYLADHQWGPARDWVVHAAGLTLPAQGTQRPLTLSLAFAAQLAQRKENLTEILEILKTWIRDLALLPYAAGRLINRDRRSTLEKAREALSDRQVWALWEAIEKAQKDIAGNANLRLTLDVMALRMAGWMVA
jgi:DNA polymerase-3 subunit delta'